MNLFVCVLIVAASVAVGIALMLFARRRAPDGSWFHDGDRASGVFGVLATGFAVLLGLVVVLAFTSFDESRSGAESEALIVAQQYETAQFLPDAQREELSGELVCYARHVVHQAWPRMQDGTLGTAVNPWAVELFRTTKQIEPESNAEQAAYGKWLDQTSDRESARNDRVHGAVGVIPTSLWVVLLFSAGVIFWYMLLFADSGEARFVQATLMGSVVAVVVSSLLLINVLDQPFHDGIGGLQPVAMERTLVMLDQEQQVAPTQEIPCDTAGLPVR
ncbi:hypothetical protein ACE2AJ_15260 [Aquihabitans daechungensis]|uniref:bestrophin-like domain n=1 Tax=Aquihabitans daechungensis TaxID=1052257 RepID=UPI003BA2E1D2